MKPVLPKVSAEMDSEIVVFLIGMRINKPWKVHKWLPVVLAMPRMLSELSKRRDSGLLGYQFFPGIVVQYWRSFEDLERFARGDRTHTSAWASFYRRVGIERGDVGIWHETYRIQPGNYEAVYGNMPAFGLGAAGRLVPATGSRATARDRLRASV